MLEVKIFLYLRAEKPPISVFWNFAYSQSEKMVSPVFFQGQRSRLVGVFG